MENATFSPKEKRGRRPILPADFEHRMVWWKEAIIISVFYSVYTSIRNQFGSTLVEGVSVPNHAFTNAIRVIRLERWIGLFHEETIQEWFLPHIWFIKTMNVYYGTAHFFVTMGVFIALYKLRPSVFGQWRNTLAVMTALAIIGFSLFPLMPPRLLDAPCPDAGFGAKCIISELRTRNGAENFGFVDTIKEFGGPWAFDSGPGSKITNQYAAMPSLHIGWSTWCAFGLWPIARKLWMRLALLIYPSVTMLCIIVTGNHFWIDGVGGLLVFAVAYFIGTEIHYLNRRRLVSQISKAPQTQKQTLD
ncbi:MAG: phosphatase PAP2 family protein [Actinobacteria bacterium]|nr:phosphatase PAP2 family protein [Actinomycetota bacterium]